MEEEQHAADKLGSYCRLGRGRFTAWRDCLLRCNRYSAHAARARLAFWRRIIERGRPRRVAQERICACILGAQLGALLGHAALECCAALVCRRHTSLGDHAALVHAPEVC